MEETHGWPSSPNPLRLDGLSAKRHGPFTALQSCLSVTRAVVCTRLGASDILVTDVHLLAPTLHHKSHQLAAALCWTPAGYRVLAYTAALWEGCFWKCPDKCPLKRWVQGQRPWYKGLPSYSESKFSGQILSYGHFLVNWHKSHLFWQLSKVGNSIILSSVVSVPVPAAVHDAWVKWITGPASGFSYVRGFHWEPKFTEPLVGSRTI